MEKIERHFDSLYRKFDNQNVQFNEHINRLFDLQSDSVAGFERFTAGLNGISITTQLLIEKLNKNEALLTDISNKMIKISNEDLKHELEEMQKYSEEIAEVGKKLLENVKLIHVRTSDLTVQNVVEDISGKVASMEGKLKVIEEKDKKLDYFMKLVAIFLTVATAIGIYFTNIYQNSNIEKIEKILHEDKKPKR